MIMWRLLLMTLLGTTAITKVESFYSRTRCLGHDQPGSFMLNCGRSSNEVLVIKRAIIGPGDEHICENPADVSIECRVDVRDELVTGCNRTNSCNVNASELQRKLPGSCMISPHIFVDYACVRVPDDEETATCRLSVPLTHPTYSIPTPDLTTWPNSNPRACGSELRPWIIEAPEGQEIYLRITSLDPEATDSAESVTETECSIAAVVSEQMQASTLITNICKERTTQSTFVYASHSNRIEVTMKQNSEGDAGSVIQFSGSGCANPVVNEDVMWMRRYDNMLIAGCRFHNRVWRLFCTENRYWDSPMSFDCPTGGSSFSYDAL